MTRSRTTAKQAGPKFETDHTKWLAERLNDDRIERRRQGGRNDRGDVTGVRTIAGARVVIEAKDYGGTVHVAEWLREAEIEASNDDAPIGVVVFKRRGIGNPSQQGVLMTTETFARLLEGGIVSAPVIIPDPHTVIADAVP